MRLGLSYAEAQAVSVEELLCLLHHAQLLEQLAAAEAETARVASLPFADPHEQQLALTGLRHQAQAALDRFHRPASNETGLIREGNEQAG